MCEADSGPAAADQLQALGLEQELELCKQFLQESQEDVEQLQAQLEKAKQLAASSSNTNSRLQRELQAAQEQNTQLQQQLASAHAAKAQLSAADAQLAAAKQQLAEASQALKAMQKAMHDLQTQRQQQEQHWAADADETAAKLAAVKSQVAAAKAELKRVQAAAEQQRAVMAAELTAAQTAEAAARADASKARAAHASCSCQLQEAQQEVAQCREQLQVLSGLRSELALLQSALTLHKHQQQQLQVDEACAQADRQQEQSHLQQELSYCREALAEAQQEVACLEADSRQLQALRRSTTPNAAPTPRSRIPSAPGAAPAMRHAEWAGSLNLNLNFASIEQQEPSPQGGTGVGSPIVQCLQVWPTAAVGASMCCDTRTGPCSSRLPVSTGSSSNSSSSTASGSCSSPRSPRRSGIPTLGPRPQTAAPTLGSSRAATSTTACATSVLALQLPGGALGSAAAAAAASTPRQTPRPKGGTSCPCSARVSISDVPASSASVSTVGASGIPGFAKASAGGVLHRDLTALRRLSAHNSPCKSQPGAGPAAAQAAGVGAPAATGAGAAQPAAAAAVQPGAPEALFTAPGPLLPGDSSGQLSSTAAAAVGRGSSPAVPRRRSCTAVPLMQALTSPRVSVEGLGYLGSSNSSSSVCGPPDTAAAGPVGHAY